MPQEGHIADRFGAWLTGTMSPAEASEVRRHVDSCAPCAEELRLLEAGTSLVAPLPAVEPRPGFAARVAARAGELHPRPVGHAQEGRRCGLDLTPLITWAHRSA